MSCLAGRPAAWRRSCWQGLGRELQEGSFASSHCPEVASNAARGGWEQWRPRRVYRLKVCFGGRYYWERCILTVYSLTIVCLFGAVLGLHCCTGFSLVVVCGLLISVASLVAGHMFSRSGTRAQVLQRMWDLPGPGIELVSPALGGGFFTTEPPGRILEWFATSFSKASSRPRNQTQVSCIADRFFTDWATRKAQGSPRTAYWKGQLICILASLVPALMVPGPGGLEWDVSLFSWECISPGPVSLLAVSFLMFSLCMVTQELGGIQSSREKLVSYLSKCTALQNQTAYLKNPSKCVLYNWSSYYFWFS